MSFLTTKAAVILGVAIATSIVANNILAHNVEISNDVAATFHIEPNHNPKAGQATKAWFALTRRGGATIPLSQCDCSLKIYSLPRSASVEPVLQPELIPTDVEKYREIPGAKVIFPKSGAYQLEISGSSIDDSFTPFSLTYSVNVLP